jgi:cytochrome c peroxidase
VNLITCLGHRKFSPLLRRVAFSICVLLASMHQAGAADLNIEIVPCYNGRPIAGTVNDSTAGISVTRVDWLLSGLALQRADGSWLDGARDWHAYFGLDGKRVGTRADGLPAGDYKAIRFRVGVDPLADAADPNIYPVDSALHSDVCGLHWDWQGGYIYLALEGKRLRPDGEEDGYSFHLARTTNGMVVELPVQILANSAMTVQLRMHVDRILQGVDFEKEGTSTHSREGDTLAPKLMTNVRSAFEVVAVRTDIFHQSGEGELAGNDPPPVGTTPYKLDITRRFPKVALPAGNPLTQEGVELGRRLFHEPRLSINDSQSCASCHVQQQAFTDPRKFSLGAKGQVGLRNAMPLFNLAWASDYFWDGRAPSLHEQVLIPIEDPHEMGESLENVVAKLEEDTSYGKAFGDAFGSPGISSDRLALALEQFLLTLVSQDSKFDRAVRKLESFTAEEKRGLELFVTEFDPARGMRGADCFHCHGGTLFSSHKYADNGLDFEPQDAGRMGVTGDAADHGKFKIPSLRNIALTAPYMHDGRFKTLEEVVDHYSTGVKRSPNLDPNLAKHPDAGIELSDDDKRALIAFLKTLTDTAFASPGGSK